MDNRRLDIPGTPPDGEIAVAVGAGGTGRTREISRRGFLKILGASFAPALVTACLPDGVSAFNQDDFDLAGNVIPPDAGAAADQNTSSGDGPPPDKAAPEEDMPPRADGPADADEPRDGSRDGSLDGPGDGPPSPEGGADGQVSQDAAPDGPVTEGGAADGAPPPDQSMLDQKPPADSAKPLDLCVPPAPQCTTIDVLCGNPMCPNGLGTKLEECRPVLCDGTLGPGVRTCKC